MRSLTKPDGAAAHPQQSRKLAVARRGTSLLAVCRLIRPHQAAKNLLIFAPLLLGHKFLEAERLVAAMWAFMVFSATASAVYVINDMVDAEVDRRHPRKKDRPFASGQLPLSFGPPFAVGLLMLAFGLAFAFLPASFGAVLLIYVVVTSLYTFWVKTKAVADVLTLAGLYALRVLAGGVATGIEVSEWTLGFTGFICLSLAFAKRTAELLQRAAVDQEWLDRRGYAARDLGVLLSVGPTCGVVSVLIFALYINTPFATSLYPNRWCLWLMCPLQLYWIMRVWLIANRGELRDDPLVFTLTDRTSILVIVAGLALFAMAAASAFSTPFLPS